MFNEDSNPDLYPIDDPDLNRMYRSARSGKTGGAASRIRAGAESDVTGEVESDSGTFASEPEQKFKGRRGGNAAASRVIHSGKKPENRGIPKDTDVKSKRSRVNKADRDHGTGQSHNRVKGRGAGPVPRPENKSPRGENEKSRSPEAVFSRLYTARIAKTNENGAFIEAPREIINSVYGQKVADNGLILLPFAEQLGRPAAGDTVSVRIYEDKGGRLAASMRSPILSIGDTGVLRVADVTDVGIFLDNGTPKQILLPFKEQTSRLAAGDEALVWLYSDKSGRTAASMRVYSHLKRNSQYKEGDRVRCFVYEVNPKIGLFVAVDDKYYGLIPISDAYGEYSYGERIEARVSNVRPDGKLDLLIRDPLYKTVEQDADAILYELKRRGGFLPYGDRADAAFIEETYAMSKNQFKRALGHLYKNHRVELDRVNDTVRLIPGDDGQRADPDGST